MYLIKGDYYLMARYDKRYDWKQISADYNSGKTFRELKDLYGFAANSWNDAVRRGDIIARKTNGKKELTPFELLKDRSAVRDRLKRHLDIPYICKSCGNTGEWLNQPFSLQLHHLDGNGKNHSLDNLVWLCPNCHALTDTYGGKNKKVT